MPMTTFRFTLAILGGLALTGAAQAQDKGGDKGSDRGDRIVEQYACKDVMRESGANRDVAIAFLHGFILGKSGDNRFNVETMRSQTDAFMERCLDNPATRALDAMTEAKK